MIFNRSRFLNNFLIISFGIFGFVALMYQVVFMRNIALLFGLTAPAAATVLAVFFFGLAFGSFVFGKISDRFSEQKNIRLYASLFALVAAYGFLFPFIFKLLNVLTLSINGVWPINFSGFNFFAFLLSFIFIAPVSILFGAGFPVVNKLLAREEGTIGHIVSFSYFIETFGSAAGALVAGFWLIPVLGNNATIFIASGLALATGSLVFVAFRKKNQETSNRTAGTNSAVRAISHNHQSADHNLRSPIFLYALFATGFLSLALEVVYTKTLILFIGSSTYAFSLILIVFLLGIALGSWTLSFFADRIERGFAYFGMFLGIIGFWLFLTLQFFEKVPFWYLQILGSYESFEFGATLFAQIFVTLIVVLPAAFIMGIVFPLGIKLAAPNVKKIGQGIGKLYFANTFGGVLGSLTAGFIFLPYLGYSRTVALILAMYFVLGGIFIAREKGLGWIVKGSMIFFFIFFALFGVFSSPWGKKNLTMGSFVYAPSYISFGKDTVRETIKGDEILFYREGLSNIAVIRRGANLLLKINGKVDASDTLEDLESEILAGILPMLFHQNPENVLAIGLGSGITLGAITQFDSVKNIDVVEIDQNILKVPEYFKESNNDAMSDSRIKTILADGRNYLLLTDKKYDVISSHPSNIWVSGNSAMFTKEYYEIAMSRLEEDGLMLQWIQAYSLSPEDIKMVFKTFQEVFPRAYLFNSANSGDLFIVGTVQKNKSILNLRELESKFNDDKIRKELELIYITSPYELVAYLVSEGDRLRLFSDKSKLNTDDNNFLEFSAPKSIYKGTTQEVLRDIDFLRSELDLTPLGVTEDSENEIELLRKHFEFRKDILPVQALLSAGDLFGAADQYKNAIKSGVRQFSIEANLLRRCNVASIIAQQSGSNQDAELIWEKCSEVFNTIEVGAPQ